MPCACRSALAGDEYDELGGFWQTSPMTDTRDGGGGPSIGNEGGGQSRWDRLRPFAEGITALTAIGALIFTGISVQQGRSQAKISEQGQYTDRYARAVEELGSTAVDVRLGGLYALERLASDSPRDVATIRQVVAAFVGDRAVYTKFLKSPDPGFLGRMLDIDAALTILSRMPKAGDPVNLGYARFTGVALDGDRFTGSLLSGTKFVQSGLQSANLTECDLRGADFSDANLEHADLSNSELSNAFLSADLVDAKLVLCVVSCLTLRCLGRSGHGESSSATKE